MLTDAEIEVNAQTYLDQVGDIIDLKKVEIRRNSEWLSGLTFADLIELAAKFSVAQLIERDDFEKRLKAGEELSLHELLYPLMQAYDSVALKADMEFGGTDQLFNLLAGRDLQRKMDQRPQVVFTVKLLVGTDGSKKMSKSLDNYVSLTDEPLEMYGKLMSMRDELIVSYYELCTSIPMATIHELMKTIAEGANPRDPKASLAREIVGIYHSPQAAVEAEAAWNHQFREGGRPDDIEDFTIRDKHLPLVDVLVSSGLATSKSEARRLIEQGGVKLDDTVQLPESEPVFADGDILQVGKRRYLKLRLK
jgi:tyrosyl-tRNA synthetase